MGLHLGRDQPAAALETCISALREDSDCLWALINGANIMLHAGMRDKAEAWLERALRLNPTNADAARLRDKLRE